MTQSNQKVELTMVFEVLKLFLDNQTPSSSISSSKGS